jgi:hypothetical protein
VAAAREILVWLVPRRGSRLAVFACSGDWTWRPPRQASSQPVIRQAAPCEQDHRDILARTMIHGPGQHTTVTSSGTFTGTVQSIIISSRV